VERGICPIAAQVDTIRLRFTHVFSKGQNLLHQFPRNQSVTGWRGQKSLVCVMSCRFPNSITTTCCQREPVKTVRVKTVRVKRVR